MHLSHHAPPRWLLALFTTAVLTPPAAIACSCTGYPTFDEAFQQSVAVFRGTVTEIESADPPYFAQLWVHLQTNGWWKGTARENVSILTGIDDGVCGFPFVVGTEYLVYALRYGPELNTDSCWRTHETGPGDPDLTLLGPPYTVPVAPQPWGTLKRWYR